MQTTFFTSKSSPALFGLGSPLLHKRITNSQNWYSLIIAALIESNALTSWCCVIHKMSSSDSEYLLFNGLPVLNCATKIALQHPRCLWTWFGQTELQASSHWKYHQKCNALSHLYQLSTITHTKITTGISLEKTAIALHQIINTAAPVLWPYQLFEIFIRISFYLTWSLWLKL